MEHIFVGGAYFATDKNDIDVYTYIAKILKDKYPKFNVIMPTDIEDYRNRYIQEHPTATLQQINKAMVDYDLQLVKTAKILIVDVSNKSTGLGIELGIIINDNKPIIFVAKHGCQISNMVLGAFPNIKVNYYKDLEDLKNILISITYLK